MKIPNMDANFDNRKTRAIMFSDITGYSKIMGEDERAALSLLETHNSLVVPIIGRHSGQVLKFIGDAILSSYESALDAVLCAIDIQKKLREHNAAKSEKERIMIRIGVHIGDVVIKDGDIFGDGVNIASRIEPLAEPGGICVSQAVYGMVRARAEINMVALGAKSLKNIKGKITIYEVVIDQPAKREPWRRRQTVRRAVVAALIALAAGLVWSRRGAWLTGPAPARDRKFVILAARFYGIDEESAKEGAVMQALTERKLRDALNGEPGVAIIGHEIAGTPRSNDEAETLGKKAGANIVLWGQVLALRDEIEIEPYLTQVQLWETKEEKVRALKTNLSQPDQLKLRKMKATELGDLALIAAARFYLRKDPDKAILLLKRINPPSAVSLAAQGFAYFIGKGDLQAAQECFKKAMANDPQLAMAHYGLVAAYAQAGRYTEAMAEYRRVMALAPKDEQFHAASAEVYARRGKNEEAAAELKKVLELNPENTMAQVSLGTIYENIGEYDEAGKEYQAVMDGRRGEWSVYAAALNFSLMCRTGKASQGFSKLKDFVDDCRRKYDTSHWEWPWQVARFYAGEISREELLKASHSTIPAIDKERQSELGYYLGMAYLLKMGALGEVKDGKSMALQNFKQSVDLNMKILIEDRLAAQELQRLTPDHAK